MIMFSRRAVGCLVVAASLALALPGPVLAQSQGHEVATRDAKRLIESLRDGGYVIVVRHGATVSDQADTDPFNFDNIAKQRNLNEKGKELAKAFGDAIRQVGIPAGKVYTSNFNRAFETAVLAGFKDIEKTTDLTEGTSQDAGAGPRQGQKHLPHHAQAQHHRRLGQGLVQCERRRSVDFQARGRQVSARGARANAGLAEARCHQIGGEFSAAHQHPE
jgi:hypothetical protein